MKHQRKKNKKILIVKIGAIGDVVMALSMINAIDLKYEGAEITWLCGKKVESLLRNCSRINKIVTLNEKNLLTGNLFIRLSEIVKTWKKLFLRKFDYTVVAYRFSGYKFLTSLTFTGILKDFTGKNRLNTFIPGRYHAVEYARLILEKDNLETTETGFPIINVTSVNVILKQLDHLKGKTIVIKLIQQHINIILIGSEQDEWVLDHFNNLNVINLIDKTSLIDLLYLFERCDLLLSHDTGVFHLAKLTGIKIIGLFGPVNPAERFGTKENVDIIFLGNTLPCSPCYDGKKFADCDNNVCMKNISVEKVYQMILNKLNSN